jgi:hypothetical protein
MSHVDDEYRNAVVGKLVHVDGYKLRHSASRMAVIETDDPFVPLVVRVWVRNWEDAQILVDRTVVFYDGHIHALS